MSYQLVPKWGGRNLKASLWTGHVKDIFSSKIGSVCLLTPPASGHHGCLMIMATLSLPLMSFIWFLLEVVCSNKIEPYKIGKIGQRVNAFGIWGFTSIETTWVEFAEGTDRAGASAQRERLALSGFVSLICF